MSAYYQRKLSQALNQFIDSEVSVLHIEPAFPSLFQASLRCSTESSLGVKPLPPLFESSLFE
jgi:hypothetical protein